MDKHYLPSERCKIQVIPIASVALWNLLSPRLGELRPFFNNPAGFCEVFSYAFAWLSFASSRIVVGRVYLRFRKNSRSSYRQIYSNPIEISFLMSLCRLWRSHHVRHHCSTRISLVLPPYRAEYFRPLDYLYDL